VEQYGYQSVGVVFSQHSRTSTSTSTSTSTFQRARRSHAAVPANFHCETCKENPASAVLSFSVALLRTSTSHHLRSTEYSVQIQEPFNSKQAWTETGPQQDPFCHEDEAGHAEFLRFVNGWLTTRGVQPAQMPCLRFPPSRAVQAASKQGMGGTIYMYDAEGCDRQFPIPTTSSWPLRKDRFRCRGDGLESQG
jgi:hypothetical protein